MSRQQFKPRPSARRASRALLLGLAVLLAPIATQAQTAAPAGAIGQGPGYHDPRSPFKPLQEREGVLAWSLLSAVSTRPEKKTAWCQPSRPRSSPCTSRRSRSRAS